MRLVRADFRLEREGAREGATSGTRPADGEVRPRVLGLRQHALPVVQEPLPRAVMDGGQQTDGTEPPGVDPPTQVLATVGQPVIKQLAIIS